MQNSDVISSVGILNNEDLIGALMIMLLLSARINAFLYASPFFSRKSMPRVVKGSLIIVVGIFVIPSVVFNAKEDDFLINYYIILVVKEILLGLVLGVFTWLPIRGLELAGVVMDTQRGATMAQDFDVIFGDTVTPTAQLLAQLFSGYFFASGGMLIVLSILLDSFTIWPPGDGYPSLVTENMTLFVEIAGNMFFTAVVLGLMIFGLLLITDIAIAVIARSAPTLNALAFASPVKSMVMIFALIFYVDVAFPEIYAMFADALTSMKKLFLQQGAEPPEGGFLLRGSIPE